MPLPERPATPRQLDELVRTKTRRSVPFRLDDAALSYQVLPAEGRGVNLLVAVARRAIVERFEAALAPLGVRVGLVDLATPNLLNLLRPRLARESADGRDAALLNCAWNHFSLVILRRGNLIFFRCKTLSLEHEPVRAPNGELTREVASSLSYYREKLEGQGIGTVLVRAVGTSTEQVAERLRALDVGAVVPIDPASAVELPAARAVDPALLHRMAPALGAAAGRGR